MENPATSTSTSAGSRPCIRPGWPWRSGARTTTKSGRTAAWDARQRTCGRTCLQCRRRRKHCVHDRSSSQDHRCVGMTKMCPRPSLADAATNGRSRCTAVIDKAPAAFRRGPIAVHHPEKVDGGRAAILACPPSRADSRWPAPSGHWISLNASGAEVSCRRYSGLCLRT